MKEYSKDFKVKTIFMAQDHFDELGGKMIVIYPHMYGDVSLYEAYKFDQYGTSSSKVMDDIIAASAESEKRTKLRITATNGDVYEFLSIVEYINNIDYGPDYMYNAPYFAHEINLAVKRRETEKIKQVMKDTLNTKPAVLPTSTGDWVDPDTSKSISYSTNTDTLKNDQYSYYLHEDDEDATRVPAGDLYKNLTGTESEDSIDTDSNYDAANKLIEEMHDRYPKPTSFDSIHESWQGS